METTKKLNRRKLILGLTGSAVGATQLPKAWTKPVIDSVILPTHAVTTGTDSSGADNTTTTTAPLPRQFSGLLTFPNTASFASLANPLSLFFAEANALDLYIHNPETGMLYIEKTGDTTFSAKLSLADSLEEKPKAIEEGSGEPEQIMVEINQSVEALYSGMGTIDGGQITLSFDSGCDLFGDVKLTVPSINGVANFAVTTGPLDNGVSGSLNPGTDQPTENCTYNAEW